MPSVLAWYLALTVVGAGAVLASDRATALSGADIVLAVQRPDIVSVDVNPLIVVDGVPQFPATVLNRRTVNEIAAISD